MNELICRLRKKLHMFRKIEVALKMTSMLLTEHRTTRRENEYFVPFLITNCISLIPRFHCYLKMLPPHCSMGSTVFSDLIIIVDGTQSTVLGLFWFHFILAVCTKTCYSFTKQLMKTMYLYNFPST